MDVALGDEGNARARLRLGDLRREVETGIEAARRDRELLDALAEIRSRHLGVKPGVTDLAYSEVFRRTGIDVDALTPAEAADRLRARPAAVALQALSSLDTWSLVRRNDEQPVERWRRPLDRGSRGLTPMTIATGFLGAWLVEPPGHSKSGRSPAGPVAGSASRRAPARQHPSARCCAQIGR